MSGRCCLNSATILVATSTVAVIELPIVMPASGTSTRASRGKMPSPKISPSTAKVVNEKAMSERSRARGTSGARRPTTPAANGIMSTIQRKDHHSSVPGARRKVSTTPRASSWIRARSDAHRMLPPRSRRSHSASTAARTTSAPAMANPTEVIAASTARLSAILSPCENRPLRVDVPERRGSCDRASWRGAKMSRMGGKELQP